MHSKSFLRLLIAIIIILIGLISTCSAKHQTRVFNDDPILLTQANKLLEKLNDEHEKWEHNEAIASWDSKFFIDRKNLNKKTYFGKVKNNNNNDEVKYINNTYHTINSFNWRNIIDYDVRRQFEKLFNSIKLKMSEQKYNKFDEIISRMEKIYATIKICDFTVPTQCDLALEPEITMTMSKSRDPEELKYIWKAWHDKMGRKIKNLYIEYIEISKKIALMNGYKDMSEMWLSDYETDNFSKQIDLLWHKIEPLYKQLHAYVRRQLRLKYGDSIVSKRGPIPAHLLGNMWAQSWINIANITMPYPEKKSLDITDDMIKQKWDENKIFHVAESFFTSLKLSPMTKSFWRNSILKKPKDRDILCHPSAWDFYDGEDFRINQCTEVDMNNLLTAYHEMGHIQYFIQYKDQPSIYRSGANPGFHEAVGDTIALSASTLDNYKQLGLLHHSTVDNEILINNLYMMALEKLAFLPFAYKMEKWRHDIFQSKVSTDNYNGHWWYFTEKYQGIIPPVKRSASKFDPGAKYHIIGHIEYMRYFVSHILQFQFHKTLCMKARKYDPINSQGILLSECNIRGSEKAGNLFKSMLKMGASRPWQDAMKKITGQRNMDTNAIIEYFIPLIEWLKSENIKHNESIGWKCNNECDY